MALAARWKCWTRRYFLKVLGAAPFARLTGTSTEAMGQDPAAQKAARYRALVIAIKDTQNIPKPLPVGVEQAKRFVQWLVDQVGLNPAHINFLVDDPAKVGAICGVTPQLADMATILKSVKATADRSELSPSDRLYFYFSGHGGMLKKAADNRPKAFGLDPRDAFFPCDYGRDDTKTPISLDWVQDWFRSTAVREQFFVFDACRKALSGDNPWDLAKPVYPNRGNSYLKVRQYFFFPSAPGEPTFDLDTSHSFSRVLLDALDYKLGFAKQYKLKNGIEAYSIQWTALKSFMGSYFERHPVVYNDDMGERREMTPVIQGVPDYGIGEGPVLIEIKTNEVGTLKLKLDISPPAARSNTTLKLEGRWRVQIPPPPIKFEKPEPVVLNLVPGEWKIVPESPQFCLEFEEDKIVPLLEDIDRTCRMKPIEGPGVPGGSKGSVRLSVPNGDPTVSIRIRDSTGSFVSAPDGHPSEGLGHLVASDLPLGQKYVAVVEGWGRKPALTEFTVDRQGMTDKTVQVPNSRPSPLELMMLDMSREAGVRLDEPSAATRCVKGLMAQLLRFIELQASHPTNESANITRTMRLRTLPSDQAQFRLLFGVDWTDRGEVAAYLRGTPVRLLRLGVSGQPERVVDLESDPPVVFGPVSALAVYQARAEPGPYLLSVGKESRALFALQVLPGRTCDVALYREPDGWLNLSQFMPSTTNPTPSETVYVLGRLQCDMLAGHSRTPRAILGAQGSRLVDDPVAAAFAALLALSRPDEEAAKAGKDVDSLTGVWLEGARRFQDLPDFLVARALMLESGDRTPLTTSLAEAAYREALDRGLPILLPFFEAAWAAAESSERVAGARYAPAARALARYRVGSQVWTAFHRTD